MRLGLIDILKLSGFDPSVPCKLIRHQDRRYPVEKLRRDNWLELYQSYQCKPWFHDVQQVVSFYGLPGTRAGFYALYKVRGHKAASSGEILDSCPWSRQWNQENKFFYDLKRDQTFNDLRDRLIIDWGRGALAFVQKLSNKPILAILEPGRKLPPFNDYLEFNLSYAELKDLFDHAGAHPDWRASLSAVAGIYLILAEDGGQQYIGSASGTSGIWGRWRDYAQSKHGGNSKLRNLIKENPNYPDRFRFSVLQILPKTMARNEVLKREEMYKEKLGTRATGLNLPRAEYRS